MPPSGARRPAPDQIAKMVTALETRMDALAVSRSESGLASVPALEPRRVCARDQEPPRSRRRRHGVSPRRHDQRRLRQRRRRADVLADADGRLPARRQPHRDAGDRRSGRLGRAGDVQAAEDRIADGARRRRAARHARRHFGRSHLSSPTATTCSAWTSSPSRSAFCSAASRPGEEIEVSLDGARLAIFQIDPRMSEEKTGPHAQDRADARQGRHASRHGRVHPALRRADQRPDRADRSHDGRHRDRHRARHHHAAAPAQPQRHRSAPRHRRQRHAEPPPRLLVPRPDRRPKRTRAPPTSSGASRRRRSGVRWPRRITRG